MLKSFFLFYLTVIVMTGAVFAQTATDSLNHQTTAYTVQNNFNSAIGAQSRLYNGKLYEYYDHSILSNAYFMDVTDWSQGSVFYDGFLYKNVDMLYDLYKDQVVIHLYNSFLKISLISDRVKYFTLLNHNYIYLKNDPSNNSSLNTGFYDELYSGKIKVFAKRDKTIQTNHSSFTGTIDSYFTPTVNNYYMYKNGNYYIVNSQGEFLNTLKDRKKELQQYIRTNKIRYKKEREHAMAMIAAYYDHLTD